MLVPFIPASLATAPLSESELPNLLLRNIFLDQNSSFQIWSPKSDAILTPLEADFLKSDRFRVEAICTRLVSLLGATCLEDEEYLLANQKIIDTWEDVKYFVSKYGFKHNAIDILYSKQTIRPSGESLALDAIQWVFEPSCWEIFFMELVPVNNGFQILPRTEQHLSVIVWTGQPIIKNVPRMRTRKGI